MSAYDGDDTVLSSTALLFYFDSDVAGSDTRILPDLPLNPIRCVCLNVLNRAEQVKRKCVSDVLPLDGMVGGEVPVSIIRSGYSHLPWEFG